MALLNSQLVVTLVCGLVLVILVETNASLVSLPINITSTKLSLQDALNNPLAHMPGTLRDYAVKGGNDCVEEGNQCTAETTPCCIVPNLDLECLPSGDTEFHVCREKDSEELALGGIDGLENGDSKGIMNSHAWADSWEFQSKSDIQREEEQAAEDLRWSKSLNRSNSGENVWTKTYKYIKNNGENIWHDFKKLNKLREITKCLSDKYLKRDKNLDSKLDVTNKEMAFNEPPGGLHVETTGTKTTGTKTTGTKTTGTKNTNYRNVVGVDESFSDYSWFYKDFKHSNTKNESSSDESFIKFSNEIPKQENNINFRIEDIIKDVTKLLSNSLMKKTIARKNTQHRDAQVPLSLQESLQNDLMASEDKLRKEINELRSHKRVTKKPIKSVESDPDKLIKKHVSAIIEEERKLDKLTKLNEINRLEKRT